MKLLIISTIMFLFHSIANAAGGHGGIPWDFIAIQALNFTLFTALIVWKTAGPIKSYFKNKEVNFKKAIDAANSKRTVAEAQYKDIDERLKKLRASKDEQVSTAQAEAKELHDKILEDAHTQSQKIKEDAGQTLLSETERIKNELKLHAVSKSIEIAEKEMKDKVGETDHQRLQKEFVEKIRQVAQ